MRITQLRIKNFGVFEDVTLKDIPSFVVFIGANGSGKSTLIDLFAFIRDALRENVRSAIDRRGGFAEVLTRERTGNIEIELTVDTDLADDNELTSFLYTLHIGTSNGRPEVKYEQLNMQTPALQFDLLGLEPMTSPTQPTDCSDSNDIALDRRLRDNEWSRGRLLLGSPISLARTLRREPPQDAFHSYLAASELHDFLSNVHLSDLQVSKARQATATGRDEHVSVHGDNLPLVSRYMHDEHPDAFAKAVRALGQRVPEISDVKVEYTIDRRVALRFYSKSVKEPFSAASVSDGTLKMWAYLLMLHDPEPHTLMCIEEPENQLHHSLLGLLAEELWSYAERSHGQVIVTTHSPELLDAVEPSQVFWLTKEDGVTTVRRGSDDPNIVDEYEFGNKLGWMWKSRALEGANPL